MIPSMSKRFEGQIQASDKAELFFQYWPAENSRGTIVITHGLAEHSDCYALLARDLQAEGYEVYAWDMRGHGRSSGKRGYVAHFSDYVSDLKTLVERVANERTGKKGPLILFGHSMGGLVTTLLAIDWSDGPISALALSSPLFGIAVEVPKLKDKIARLTAQWLPSITLHNEIKYTDLTRDNELLKTYNQDVLRHDRISPQVYLGMIDGGSKALKEAGKIRPPVLLQVAGHDRIVSSKAEQQAFPLFTNPKSVMQLYPDSYHEIYNDLDRPQALTDFKKFLTQLQGEK